MIRLANAAVDYWISPSFTWTLGGHSRTFNHNKGKYVKHAIVYNSELSSRSRYMHSGIARDASGSGNDYGVAIHGPSSQDFNSITFFFYNPYADSAESDCVMYLEFLEATLPN